LSSLQVGCQGWRKLNPKDFFLFGSMVFYFQPSFFIPPSEEPPNTKCIFVTVQFRLVVRTDGAAGDVWLDAVRNKSCKIC
jgi:hypothetical protein